MRAPVVSRSAKTSLVALILLLACALAQPAVAGEGVPGSLASHATGLGDSAIAPASTDPGSSDDAPVLAGSLSDGMLRVSADVALVDAAAGGAVEPVVGSFTVDGLTYAIVGEGQMALVAVSPKTLAVGLADIPDGGSSGAPSEEDSGSGVPTSPSPSPEGAPSDGAEGEEASEPVTFEVPGSVEYGGTTYSVVAIGPRAFAGCDADAVTIPATVGSVDGLAFRGSSVKAIKVADGNPSFSSYDGMLFDADMTSLLLVPEGKQGAARIPKAAEVVPADAFSHCASVTAIEADAGSAAFSSRNGSLYDASGEALVASPATIDALSGAAAPRAGVRGTFNSTQDGVVYHYRADDLAELMSQGASLSDDRMSEFELDESLVWRNVGAFPGEYPYAAASPTRHLLGWSTKPSGGALIEPGTRAGSTWNVYAVFGPRVSWDANGGEAPVASSPVWVGEAVTSPVPTREGYRCLGWFTAPEGGELACEPGGQTPPVSADLALYAQWEALGAPIPISYDLGSEPGGGEAGSWPEGAEPPMALAPDAGLVALPEPVRAGYALAGWSVKGQPGADLLSRGEGGAWTIDSSKLPDYADEEGAVTLVARWTAKVEVEAPLEATFLYDLARDGAAESSAPKDAWSGGAEGASLLRNRSAVPVRVCGMGSVAAEGASVLLGPGGSTLAEAAAGGPKVLSVFPTTDPATGTRADAEGPATDGEGDDLAHKVDLSLSSTLLEGAFASAPDGSPDAARRAAWTVPAAQSGLNGVPVPGSLKLGFRLNLGGSTGATVDRSALLAATGGDATGTAKVPIAGLSYCFALEGASKPLPTGSKDDPLWVEVTQEFIDENGLQGSASPGVYGLADIKAAANDMASCVSASTDPNDYAAIEAEAGQSPYWPLYEALMDHQGRDASGSELGGPYLKAKIKAPYDSYMDVGVIGICQDVRADTNEKAGLTLAAEGSTETWRPYETYNSDWSKSNARSRIQNEVMKAIAPELADPNTGIVPVRKYTNTLELTTSRSTETIFLLSGYEYAGKATYECPTEETASNSFRYARFAAGKLLTNTARTPTRTAAEPFGILSCIVTLQADGGLHRYTTNTMSGVHLIFCL